MPARVGGAWYRLGRAAQQQESCARFFRCQRKAAACGQVDLRQATLCLDDHCADIAAACGIDAGAQQGGDIACQNEQALAGVDTKLCKSRCIGYAAAQGMNRIEFPRPVAEFSLSTTITTRPAAWR